MTCRKLIYVDWFELINLCRFLLINSFRLILNFMNDLRLDNEIIFVNGQCYFADIVANAHECSHVEIAAARHARMQDFTSVVFLHR